MKRAAAKKTLFSLAFIPLLILLLAFLIFKSTFGQSPLTFDLKLKAGWNMVSLPFADSEIKFEQSNCYFLYIYALHLNSTTKKYEKLNLASDEEKLRNVGLFVYSYNECTLKISGTKKLQMLEIKLKKGSNHIAVPYDGIELGGLSGCKINKITYLNSTDGNWYKWEAYWGSTILYSKQNPVSKKWERIGESNSFLLPAGVSIFVDVSEDCTLNLKTATTSTTLSTSTSTI
jgi:hypothetical protein